jgi:hypothetical protein
MADKLPQTQEEARTVIASRIKDTVDAYNAAKRAGDETQANQLLVQYRDLNKQYEAAKQGTGGSIVSGLMSGVRQGFDFPASKFAIPVISAPTTAAQFLLNRRYGAPVNEPQSQEQLVPFRAGQGVGTLATGLLTPGNTAKALATGAGLTAADIGIESQGGPQSAATGAYLVGLLAKGGWKGLKNWNEGRKFENLMDKLPKDIPELDRNALKRFMLTGQGADNGIVAAAMQKLETKPEFAEMLKKLREGATEQTLSGMRPETGRLTKEQSGTGLVQTIQNKLDGLKETVASSIFDPKGLSLYDKAKGYGGGKAIVEPTNTVANIDSLITEFQAKNTPDAENAVKALESMKARLTSASMVNPEQAAFAAVGGPAETTNKRTIEQVQGVLSEFGKKASQGDTLLKDLSISSEQRISAAIFGGMKDDIRASFGSVTDPNDRKALTLLGEARDRTANAAERYNTAVAQGMPAFLKDADPRSLDFTTLTTQYEQLTPQQRASVRQWVGDTDPEVLKQFDRQVYTNFLDKARDAEGRVDLGTLTQLWNKSIPADKDALVTALGVNAGEFTARMRDATAFNNRIRVAQPTAETNVVTEAAPAAARLAGTAIGYGAHQGVMLSSDIAKQLLDKTKLTDEQLMKLFLSPEGADFLKTQKLTPGSAELLDKLTKVTTPTAPATGAVQTFATGTQEAAPAVPTAPTVPAMPEFVMPEDVQPTEQTQQPAFVMPD